MKELKCALSVEIDVDDTQTENSSPYNNEIEVDLKRIKELETVLNMSRINCKRWKT